MSDDIQKNVSSAKQYAEELAKADAKANDNTKASKPEESIRLMLEIDSKRSDINTWTSRINTVRAEIARGDKELRKLDKTRLEEIQHNEAQHNMMLSAVHYDEVDASPGSFVEEELKEKKAHLEKLMDAFADKPDSPWFQRYQLTQKIVHARSEIERLEQVTLVLEQQLPPQKPSSGFAYTQEMIEQSFQDDPPDPEPWFEEFSPSDEIMWQMDGAQERLDWERLIQESEERKQAKKLKEEQEYTERLLALANEVEGEPVGIELAAEIQIRTQQDMVTELAAVKKAQQDGLKIIQQGAVDHLESQMDALNELADEYDRAYGSLTRATLDKLYSTEDAYNLSDIVKAGEPWLYDDIPTELKSHLDMLSWEDALPIFSAIQEVKKCDASKAAIDEDDKRHKQFHPKALSEAQARLEETSKKFDIEQAALRKMVTLRKANQSTSDNKKQKQVVSMSGTASAGITAVATASVVKARVEAARRQDEVEAVEKESVAADETNDALSFQIQKLEKMVDANRKIRGLQPQRAVDWRSKIRRTRKGTEDISHTVAVLNDEMPSLIRREASWGFESIHGKEALALRTGIVMPRGKLDVTVADRGHHEGNILRCWLDKHDIYIDLAIVVVNQGKWQIRTVVNNEATEDWPYYEMNTKDVPKNALDMRRHEGKKITLEMYAEWHRLIMNHINKDVAQQAAS